MDPSPAELESTLKKAAAALRDSGVPYLLAGSYASWARGGPERRNDLDFVVKPEDFDQASEALAAAGLEPVDAPEEWLNKVRDDNGVMVDLIHSPAGLPIDDEVMERGDDVDVAGMTFRVMALEDVLTTKLFAFKEHYLDYEAILEIARTLRDQVDWDELRRRAGDYPYAKPFFVLAEELGVIEREDGGVPSPEEVKEAQTSQHG
jgi:predicted nucleotidyltransferase